MRFCFAIVGCLPSSAVIRASKSKPGVFELVMSGFDAVEFDSEDAAENAFKERTTETFARNNFKLQDRDVPIVSQHPVSHMWELHVLRKGALIATGIEDASKEALENLCRRLRG